MKKKIMAFLLAATMVVGCATTASAGQVNIKGIKDETNQQTSATFWNSDASNFRTANPSGYNAVFANQTDATSKAIAEAYRAGKLATDVEGTTQVYGTLGAYSRADKVVNYGTWITDNNGDTENPYGWKTTEYHLNSKTEANDLLYTTTTENVLTGAKTTYVHTNGTFAVVVAGANATADDAVKNLSWGAVDKTNYDASLKVVDLSVKKTFSSGDLASNNATAVGSVVYLASENSIYVLTNVAKGIAYQMVPEFMGLTLKNTDGSQATWRYQKIDNHTNGSALAWNNKEKNVAAKSYRLFMWKDEYSSRIYNEDAQLNTKAKEAVDKAWADAISPYIVKAYNEAKGELSPLADDAKIGDIIYLEAKLTSGTAGKYVLVEGTDIKAVTDKAKAVKALHWNASKSEWEQVEAVAIRDYTTNDNNWAVRLTLADFSPIMIIEVTDEGNFVNEAAAAAPNKSVQTGASFLGL